MIYVLLANGFEEMEAMAPIDLLRRADCDVKTVAIGDTRTVKGAHAIPVVADLLLSQVTTEGLQAVVLPGGMPGTRHLEASSGVQELLDFALEQELVVGAICAAPSILGHKGCLEGKRATCYPGFEQELYGAIAEPEASVVTDGRFVTAKGAGVSAEFGLALVSILVSAQEAQRLREGIQCK